MNLIIAVYCYTGTGESQKIVIVTSSTGRWILPKGQPEKKFTKKAVALDEAWEEAGVKGVLAGKAVDLVIKRGEKAVWRFYPVRIEELADDWPEKVLRQRRLVSPEEAAREIDNRSLSEAVIVLAKKFRNS